MLPCHAYGVARDTLAERCVAAAFDMPLMLYDMLIDAVADAAARDDERDYGALMPRVTAMLAFTHTPLRIRDADADVAISHGFVDIAFAAMFVHVNMTLMLRFFMSAPPLRQQMQAMHDMICAYCCLRRAIVCRHA